MTVCDSDDIQSLNQLRKDPLFVDLQEGRDVDFVFPPSAEFSSSAMVPRSHYGSKANLHHTLHRNRSSPLLVRSSSIKQGLEQASYHQKIPLYVPSRIIKPASIPPPVPRRASSLSTSDPPVSIGDAGCGRHAGFQAYNSTEALSEASEWSTTVQFGALDRDLDDLEPEDLSTPIDNSSSGRKWKLPSLFPTSKPKEVSSTCPPEALRSEERSNTNSKERSDRKGSTGTGTVLLRRIGQKLLGN